MLLPVLVRHFHPAGNILLKRGINDQFLADGMPGQFPGELVLVADLVVFVGGGEDPVEEGLDLAVVVHDRIHDPGCHGDGGGCYFALAGVEGEEVFCIDVGCSEEWLGA